LAVAGLTTREMVRQPLTLLVTACAVAVAALLPLLTTHTLDEGEKIIADNALALHFFLGLFLAAMSASHAMSAELRRGTAAAVLAKPVDRAVFFLAKYAGLAAGMAMYSAILAPATLMAARVVAVPFFWDWRVEIPFLCTVPLALLGAAAANFLTRRSFASLTWYLLLLFVLGAFVAGGWQPKEGIAPERFGAFYLRPMFAANGLIAVALLVLTAIALAASTRLEAVPTMVLSAGVFLVGLVSDHLFAGRADRWWWAGALRAVVPNWQHFWLADAVLLDAPVPPSYIVAVLGYAAAYLIGILAVGIVMFRSAEVKT